MTFLLFQNKEDPHFLCIKVKFVFCYSFLMFMVNELTTSH
jgi:hypothetical protein